MVGIERAHGSGSSYGPPDADAIIVGAGPAGSITALLLARQGRDVLVLDRDELPRPKPCGDCLSAAATGLLDRIGLLDRVLESGADRLDGWRIAGPSGGTCGGRFDGAAALALERRVLDRVLLDAALEAGARFLRVRVRDLLRSQGREPTGSAENPGPLRACRDGSLVVGVEGRDADGGRVRLRAGLVVGADGLRSVVSRRLDRVRRQPRLRKVSLTTHGTLPGSLRTFAAGRGVASGPAGTAASRIAARRVGGSFGEMFVLDGGCFGFAPAGRGRFNLTLVVGADRAEELRDGGPDAFFRSWLQRVPALAGRIGDADLDPFLASGPFDWPVRSVAAPGAALVGDAAGYYDPFTGQGIYQAMAGAELLAGELGPALGSDRQHAALRRYARRHRRLTAPARRFQRIVELGLSRPRRADRLIARLAAAPRVMDRVVEVTGDLRRPISLLSPRLVTSFVIPPHPGAA